MTEETKDSKSEKFHCAFCGKSQDDVALLIGSQDKSGPYICNECVAKCTVTVLNRLQELKDQAAELQKAQAKARAEEKNKSFVRWYSSGGIMGGLKTPEDVRDDLLKGAAELDYDKFEEEVIRNYRKSSEKPAALSAGRRVLSVLRTQTTRYHTSLFEVPTAVFCDDSTIWVRDLTTRVGEDAFTETVETSEWVQIPGSVPIPQD